MYRIYEAWVNFSNFSFLTFLFKCFYCISSCERHLSNQKKRWLSASFSSFPSQEGVIKGNVIVHERQHLHHLSITFPLWKASQGGCCLVCITFTLIINEADFVIRDLEAVMGEMFMSRTSVCFWEELHLTKSWHRWLSQWPRYVDFWFYSTVMRCNKCTRGMHFHKQTSRWVKKFDLL